MQQITINKNYAEQLSNGGQTSLHTHDNLSGGTPLLTWTSVVAQDMTLASNTNYIITGAEDYYDFTLPADTGLISDEINIVVNNIYPAIYGSGSEVIILNNLESTGSYIYDYTTPNSSAISLVRVSSTKWIVKNYIGGWQIYSVV